MLRVPNVPAEEVPEGETDADNVVVKTWGEPTRFDFTPLDHVELGERLDIIDIPRAVKLAGARTYFLKNAGALLEQAVLQFALHHMVRKGFAPFLVPHLVKDDPMVGTAYFPVGQEQTYRLQETASTSSAPPKCRSPRTTPARFSLKETCQAIRWDCRAAIAGRPARTARTRAGYFVSTSSRR